jgi:hypothetical protein
MSYSETDSLTNRNLIENVNKYDIDILEKNVKKEVLIDDEISDCEEEI